MKFEKLKQLILEKDWLDYAKDEDVIRQDVVDLPYPSETEMKGFQVTDKNGKTYQIVIGGFYGTYDQMTREMPKMPDKNLLDQELLDKPGIVYGFTAMDNMLPTDRLLNVFNRKTVIEIISNVIKLMINFYEKNSSAEWVLFGGFADEPSKMKLYNKIADQISKKFNVNKKILNIPGKNETYFVLRK